MSFSSKEHSQENAPNDHDSALKGPGSKERADLALKRLLRLSESGLLSEEVEGLLVFAEIIARTQNGQMPPLPPVPEVQPTQFNSIEKLCSLRRSYVEAREKVEAVCELFRERFGNITLVVHLDERGRFTSIPVCDASDDPLRMLCKKSEALKEEGELPVMRRLNVNFVTRNFDFFTSDQQRSRALDRFDWIILGEGGLGGPLVQESDKVVVHLQIDESSEQFKSRFFYNLKKLGVFEFYEPLSVKLFKPAISAFEIDCQGSSVQVDRNMDNYSGRLGQLINSDSVPPFTVLKIFQEALLKAREPNQWFFRSFRRGDPETEPRREAVDMEFLVETFYLNYAVKRSFDRLDEALISIQSFSGLSFNQVSWIAAASEELLRGSMNLGPLKEQLFTETRLDESPAYFRDFYSSVRALIDHASFSADEVLATAATAALTALEEGLTNFANQNQTQ